MSRNSASSTIRLAKHKGFWINISLECTSSIPFTPKIRRSRVLGIQNETSWKWPSCKIASNTHYNRTPTHLIVPANSEQRRTSSENIFRWNLCKLLKDELVPNHLLGPLIHRAASPEVRFVVVRDRMDADVMAATVKLLQKVNIQNRKLLII